MLYNDTRMEIKRRTHHYRKPQQPLDGFALDVTLYVTDRDRFRLSDQNGKANQIFDNEDEMFEHLIDEFERNYEEHFR